MPKEIDVIEPISIMVCKYLEERVTGPFGRRNGKDSVATQQSSAQVYADGMSKYTNMPELKISNGRGEGFTNGND